MKQIVNKFSDIKILFFDLDGVLTSINDKLHAEFFCHEFENFCARVKDFGMKVYVITGRESDALTARLEEIDNCKVKTASVNKVQMAGEILIQNLLNFDAAFFIGDNILDIPLMQRVGLKACPANARREVKRIVDFICRGEKCDEVLSEIFGYLELSRTKKTVC